MKTHCIQFFVGMLFALALCLLGSGCEKEKAPLPKGRIKLVSIPEGAEIFLGEKSLGMTPQSLSGAPGRRRIRVEKPGYQTRWVEFVLANGDKKELEIVLAEQGSGVLVVSRPEHAEVVMQGKKIGMTPLVLPGMMPGKYEMQIRKPGFAERSVPFSVNDLRPQEILVDLVSNVGSVRIASVPTNARITIDGKPYGFTPFSGELEAGQHRVRLEKNGAVPLEMTIDVGRDQKLNRSFKLATAPGSIEVNSDPAGAQIRLDGKLVGIAPVTLKDVASGKHEISAGKAGFDSVTKTVEVAPGSCSEVDFVLESSTGQLHLSVVPAGVSVYLNDKFLGNVKGVPGASVNRTEMIRVSALKPGNYRITVAHKRAVPERKTMVVAVKKGKVNRPEPIELWVPNAEVKWMASGLVETGMLYAESDSTITFGAEPGVRVVYPRSRVASIRKLNINE